MTASHARTLTISRAIQRDDIMLETLTFLLSHISQTFKIKENRIFKQKTRDISYRDRERRLPRRKVEYISSWRGKEVLFLLLTFSFLTVSHCPQYTIIHGSCVYIYMRGVGAWSRHHVCLLTNTPAPVCPSLWLTPNSRISRPKPSPCRGRDIFPGSRLGFSLHSRTFLRSVASEICRDGPWGRGEAEWRWSQEPVSGCLCGYR